MMDDPADYSHLNDTAKALVSASDATRIHAIRSGTWLAYPRAKEILTRLEDLLEYPRIHANTLHEFNIISCCAISCVI